MKTPCKTVTITVTTAHIRRGKRTDCSRCPIALAISPIFRKGYVANVYPSGIQLFDHIKTLKAFQQGDYDISPTNLRLPEQARDFIVDFDEGMTVHHPFSFEMKIPKNLLR